MPNVEVYGVDISHLRLVELAKLADQAGPFYNWVERVFQKNLGSGDTLHAMIQIASIEELEKAIRACFSATDDVIPLLVDGIGRSYSHSKACYYFLSWMARDAPQQRLQPLLGKMQESGRRVKPIDSQSKSLARLFFQYREVIQDFTWPTVREVVMDRLEGSRRSLKGHAIEVFTRTALVSSFQSYLEGNGDYGRYRKVSIAETQVTVHGHTFDSSAVLERPNGSKRLLLVPVKTRETQGGGHAHLFTRDVVTAVTETKIEVPDALICLVIVAQHWSDREIAGLGGKLDLVVHFNENPNAFVGFGPTEQRQLDIFVRDILDGNT